MNARKFVLLFSLFQVAFMASHVLFMGATGRGIAYLFTVPGYMALPVLGLAAFLYARADRGSGISRGWRHRLLLFAFVLGLLAIAGLLKGYGVRAVADDLWIYLYFLLFVILGRYDEVWRDLEKPLILFFWLLFALTIWGLFLPRPLVNEYGELVFVDIAQDRPTINTAGYEFHRILGFWPLVFMLGCLSRLRITWRMLAVASAFAFLVLSVAFQKRAPFVRTLLYMLPPLLILLASVQRRRFLLGFAILFCLVLGLAFTVRTSVFQQLETRYRAEASLWESSRLVEARAMFDDLQWPEYIFGRGLGGYYTPPPDWDAGVVRISEQGDLGRRSLHIGILVPILKGGVLFWIVTYSLYWPVLRPRRRLWYSSPLNMCAVAIIPVYVASQLIEGGASMGNVFDALLIGMVIGRLGTVVQSPSSPEKDQGSQPAEAGVVPAGWRD